MISDEIKTLRSAGRSDEQIASVTRANSAIEITGEEIAVHGAPRESRHHHGPHEWGR